MHSIPNQTKGCVLPLRSAPAGPVQCCACVMLKPSSSSPVLRWHPFARMRMAQPRAHGPHSSHFESSMTLDGVQPRNSLGSTPSARMHNPTMNQQPRQRLPSFPNYRPLILFFHPVYHTLLRLSPDSADALSHGECSQCCLQAPAFSAPHLSFSGAPVTWGLHQPSFFAFSDLDH